MNFRRKRGRREEEERRRDETEGETSGFKEHNLSKKTKKKHTTAAAQLSGRRSTIYPEREVGVKAEKASEAENVDFWRGSVNKGPV